MLDPASFEYFAKYSRRLAKLRDGLQPQAKLWTGETGSAQCGGQPYRSDRWISGFWRADQLGQGARLGQRVMVRQALVGGDYSLVDCLALKPRPDYWVSWLWPQLMGTAVYAAARLPALSRRPARSRSRRDRRSTAAAPGRRIPRR